MYFISFFFSGKQFQEIHKIAYAFGAHRVTQNSATYRLGHSMAKEVIKWLLLELEIWINYET